MFVKGMKFRSVIVFLFMLCLILGCFVALDGVYASSVTINNRTDFQGAVDSTVASDVVGVVNIQSRVYKVSDSEGIVITNGKRVVINGLGNGSSKTVIDGMVKTGCLL